MSERVRHGRIVPVMMMAWVAAAAAAVPLGGQQASSPAVGCLRGRPLASCRSFWIVEAQGVFPLLASSRSILFPGAQGPERAGPTGGSYSMKAFESQLEWNLGHMVNVSPRVAVGGAVTLGTGSSDPLTGVRGRARWWITDEVSAEGEAGMLRSNGGGGYHDAVNGATFGARLNIRDQGAVFLRYDVLQLPTVETEYQVDPGGRQSGFSLGVGVGSVPALVGTGAVGLVYAVLLGVFLAHSN